MGYTTDFSGRFDINKPLSDKMFNFLKAFNETRRMGRNVDVAYGIQGEFFVFGEGFGSGRNEENAKSIIDHNEPPTTQPGLWCQWTPSDDRMGIEWDGGEKFYNYTEWLVYLIHKVLAPNGYVLNGTVTWQGEDTGDVGEIIVEDNRVFTEAWKGSKEEVTPQSASKYSYKGGNNVGYMQIETVLILDGDIVLPLDESKQKVEEPRNESKDFATWLIIHTDEVTNTAGACRRYKNKVMNVNELYDIYLLNK